MWWREVRWRSSCQQCQCHIAFGISGTVSILHSNLCQILQHSTQIGIKEGGKAVPVTGRGGPYGCETSGLPHFLDSRLRDGVRLSALRAGRSEPPRRFLVLIPVTGWVDTRAMVRLEGVDKFKNPVKSSEIQTVTFRLVAVPPSNKHLNSFRAGHAGA
jgi:hypothetical protein